MLTRFPDQTNVLLVGSFVTSPYMLKRIKSHFEEQEGSEHSTDQQNMVLVSEDLYVIHTMFD